MSIRARVSEHGTATEGATGAEMFEREPRPSPSRISDSRVAALVRKVISSRGGVYTLDSGRTATRAESSRAVEQSYRMMRWPKGHAS